MTKLLRKHKHNYFSGYKNDTKLESFQTHLILTDKKDYVSMCQNLSSHLLKCEQHQQKLAFNHIRNNVSQQIVDMQFKETKAQTNLVIFVDISSVMQSKMICQRKKHIISIHNDILQVPIQTFATAVAEVELNVLGCQLTYQG